MLCRYCSKSDFRQSRFHREDIVHLLVLQLPVRCRNCHHRVYANIFYARTLPAANVRPTKAGEPASKPSDA